MCASGAQSGISRRCLDLFQGRGSHGGQRRKFEFRKFVAESHDHYSFVMPDAIGQASMVWTTPVETQGAAVVISVLEWF